MVYFFEAGKAEGAATMKNLLGGKGANLAEMANLGLPVPAGFTITTEVCTDFYKSGGRYPEGLTDEIKEALAKVEKAMGAKFGDPDNPLLLSSRSGARISMPGMMDTVLNIGLNDATVKGLIARTGNERFVYDAYRRFVNMYADVVLGVQAGEKEEDPFELILEAKKRQAGVEADVDLSADDLKDLVAQFKELVNRRTGRSFPEEPAVQLDGAIGAVFESWMVPRAVSYREIHNVPGDWGTAVNVQSMVFGNMGQDCATGVAFTRDPATGENYFYGEYLTNAQGEDVVAGTRTPQPINRVKDPSPEIVTLDDEMPQLYQQLDEIRTTLERHYQEMQDVEFTIQQHKLWMLQTRTGKRTAQAAIKIAVDMVDEGLIDQATAIRRIEADQLDHLLHPAFDSTALAQAKVLATGLAASPGAAGGRVVFSAEEAEEWHARGEKVILVRIETSPDDIRGMNAAEGILTARGGMTSHAAVVARGMGTPCVAGCTPIQISYAEDLFHVDGETVKKGDWISLDGATGRVFLGQIKTVASAMTGEFGRFMDWVDEFRTLGVRANADTPHDSEVARGFGAEGIGLCRTEHMFFEGERIDAVREMIVARDERGRREALSKLLPMQREDFVGIFRAMDGLPVTIRTLDPPLHEFLPHTEAEIQDLAYKINAHPTRLTEIVASLSEANPMLGHRGCRLGIYWPEITEMQARAIFEAACQVTGEGVEAHPEVMIPLVGTVEELRRQRKVVVETARQVFKETGIKVDYLVGTMIELPRACLVADQIAKEADFFSFGTNDLTQTTFGLSRDDAGKFLPFYVREGILPADPFVSIDVEGVGALVKMGVKLGRRSRRKLKVGICGEHGGDPASVAFCHAVGLDYVSCSPYRVPIARLAAAQAALAGNGRD